MPRIELKVALRLFFRKKLFTLINVISLSIGISAALVIYLIVHHELSHENFIQDGERIFRVVSNMHFPDNEFKNSGVPGPLTSAIPAELTGIEKEVLFVKAEDLKVSIEQGSRAIRDFKNQEEIIYADDRYFTFLPYYRWLAGNKVNALTGPGKTVLTEKRARQYFQFISADEIIGRTIIYQDSISTVVTGVVSNLEEITDFSFLEFVSLETMLPELRKNAWDEWGSITSATQFFIQVQEGIAADNLEARINALRQRKTNGNDFLVTEHYLQPLKNIHFEAEFGGLGDRTGHRPTLYGLMIVGLFLLLLGCTNYINLSTAQSSLRAKEIGVRKTIGSSRGQLIRLYLTETALLTFIALLASLLLVPILIQQFRDFIPPGVTVVALGSQEVLIFSLILIVLVSVLAGFYPAWVLTRFNPVVVLKNHLPFIKGEYRGYLRKVLTVGQFVIAQLFVIATLVVGKQIRFVLNQELGFNQDAIVIVHGAGPWEDMQPRQTLLHQKIKNLAAVKNSSLSGVPPATDNINVSTVNFNQDGRTIETSVELRDADSSYFNLYGLKLLAGRYLHYSDTSREYVINATFAKFLGYDDPTQLIGKTLDRGHGELPIVGVLNDFHARSMHEPIKPLLYTTRAKQHHTIHVALQSASINNLSTIIGQLEQAWQEVYGDEPFNYEFFDESIAKFYLKEKQTAKLLTWCAALAILISCLGILGLVIHITQIRLKEVGIRKILGATALQLFNLLAKEFSYLVTVACLLAIPFAWWGMSNWLKNYAFRTNLPWWIFALAFVIMMLVALATLSINTIKTAQANPVQALRNE